MDSTSGRQLYKIIFTPQSTRHRIVANDRVGGHRPSLGFIGCRRNFGRAAMLFRWSCVNVRDCSMTDKEISTLPRPSKIFFEKPVSDRPAVKPPVVLDMGEASREEGFRLNGCR
jgi:hypothetical protein